MHNSTEKNNVINQVHSGAGVSPGGGVSWDGRRWIHLRFWGVYQRSQSALQLHPVTRYSEVQPSGKRNLTFFSVLSKNDFS